MENYTRVIGATSTNIRTPTTPEINQGNDPLTPYESAKNNGYYNEMSKAINNVSTEVVNVIMASGIIPGPSLTQLRDALASPIFSNPIGSSIIWNSAIPPTGYLEENGAAISRTAFANLFSIVGTTFGPGDGSTTFNIPDSRGYSVRGWDNGRGIDSGRALGSNQQDAFQGHYHSVNGGGFGGVNQMYGVTAPGALAVAGTVPSQLVGVTYISDGVNGTPRVDAETRPINIAKMYCIKY